MKHLILTLAMALILATPAMAFKVKVDSCTGSGDYTRTEGSITNTGNKTVHFVTMRLTWLNAAGQVVDTASTYAVGSEMLRPGESTQYSGSTRAKGVSKCRAGILNYRNVK